jgi:crotonobetainyl-CoA:carnitine CoA-transferase CaiB-like acyl-CoA transferase
MKGALDGIVVADFTRVLAGPLATMTLGDLGADVIKVEREFTGDDTREWGPPFVDGVSAYYLSVNRNKRSVTIDLASEEGRRTARSLADRADVLVENFRPGLMEKFGLGYDELATSNPGIVYCSISGFGLTGGRDLVGYDFLVQAMGGLMSITGYADAEPVKVGVAIVDVVTGLNATIAILAALRHRERTGLGQRVDVDLLSSLLSSLVNQASSFLADGESPGRMGNQHPSIAPYEMLATSDRPLVVAIGNDNQFVRLCEVIGVGSVATDERFRTNRLRVANRANLVIVLEEALAKASAAHWVTVLTAAGVPCGLLNDVREAFEFAERLGLQPTVELKRDDDTTISQVASPLRLATAPIEYKLPPPRLGEHNEVVLAFLNELTEGEASSETGKRA